MANKYYWLKLDKDFFKSHDIRIVEEMPNGKDYILFYLKLMVESITHEGELRFSETIPYDENMLAIVTNTNVDVVRSAMKIFIQLGMIMMLEDSTIYLAEVKKMIGSESASAERVRAMRARNKMKELAECNNVTKCNENVTESKSKSKSKSKKDINYDEIVAYMNECCHTNYKASTPKTQELIRARINDGFSTEDFKTVIKKMADAWMNTEWEKYLRPQTLFGTKFESYLNSKQRTGKKKDYEGVPRYVDDAKCEDEGDEIYR